MTMDTRSGEIKLLNSFIILKKLNIKHSIINNKANPDSIYKIFQEVGAGKGLHRQSTVTSVKVGDTLIEDPTEMANEFNDFFC